MTTGRIVELDYASASSAPADRPRTLLAIVSMFVLSWAVFGPTLRHQFVWDDLEQVRDNELIRDWKNFPKFWQTDILALSRKGGVHHSNYYRPLFYVQYQLYYQVFGLDTRWWHAAAILHHFLAGCGVLLLTRRLGFSRAVSWMAAMLFIVHPAHGESVSWVAAAFNDPPAATLLLFGLAAHARWLRSGRALGAMLGGLAYAAALCLKESALSMLLLVPLIDWYVRAERGWFARAMGYVPYWVLTALFVGVELVDPGGFASGHPHAAFLLQLVAFTAALLATAALVRAPGERWFSQFVNYAPYFLVTLTYFYVRKMTLGSMLGEYAAAGSKTVAELAPTFPLLAVFYLRLLLWPLGMSPSYGLRYVPGWSDVQAWGSVLALAVIGAALLVMTRRRRPLQLGIVWTICCIWPVFNIRSFLPTYLAHQRYLYLAAFGVCLIVAWLLAQLRRGHVRRAVLGAVIAAWSASNLYYNGAWATDHELWTRICEADPKNPAGFDWLGGEARRQGKVERARELYRQSMAADPDLPFSYLGIALTYHIDERNPTGALAWYQDALTRFAAHKQRYSLEQQSCLVNYAACLADLGRVEEAIKIFIDTAGRAPYPTRAAGNAALLLHRQGESERAERVLLQSLTRHPGDREVLRWLLILYRETNQIEKAERVSRQLGETGPAQLP